MIASTANLRRARHYEWIHRLTLIATMTAAVSILLISSLSRSFIWPTQFEEILIQLLALIVSILTAMGSYADFSRLAERHRSFASRYNALRRSLELTLASAEANDPIPIEQIRRAIEDLERLDIEAPQIDLASFRYARDVLEEAGPRDRASAELSKRLGDNKR
jgi:hypothetical protein